MIGCCVGWLVSFWCFRLVGGFGIWLFGVLFYSLGVVVYCMVLLFGG